MGVACRPLAANEPGALAVTGVYDFLKATNVAYMVGTILYWDDTNNIVTTTATGNKHASGKRHPQPSFGLGRPLRPVSNSCEISHQTISTVWVADKISILRLNLKSDRGPNGHRSSTPSRSSCGRRIRHRRRRLRRVRLL